MNTLTYIYIKAIYFLEKILYSRKEMNVLYSRKDYKVQGGTRRGDDLI